MFPPRFRYEAPRSVSEAVSLLRDGGGEAKVLAGGQSLVPLLKLRFASPEVLVDINNLPDLATTASARTARCTSAPCAGTSTSSAPGSWPRSSRRWPPRHP